MLRSLFLLAVALATATSVSAQDVSVWTHYSPDTRLRPAAFAQIEAATGTCYFAALAYSDTGLTAAFRSAMVHGAAVNAVLNVSSGTNAIREAWPLAAAGATVTLARFPNLQANRFIATGGTGALTGTYYWSPSAVQTGNYLMSTCGTATPAADAVTYAALTASGTPIGLEARRPAALAVEPDVLFSPNGGCQLRIQTEIAAAQTSIFAEVYTATNVGIFQSLVAAKRRGVNVQIVADKYCSTLAGAQIQATAAAGVPVFLDDHEKIMHNKVLIIDGHKLLTGSYNFSEPAETSNAENLLVLDDQALAAAYMANWMFHRSHSSAIGPAMTTEPPACPTGTCPFCQPPVPATPAASPINFSNPPTHSCTCQRPRLLRRWQRR